MIYFASDFHLGSPNYESSRSREIDICNWLDFIKDKATEIYFLGDTFDFWFEYNAVVPKGYIRFLGKLSELHDRGIKLHMCLGNHDLWIGKYLQLECGVHVFSEPKTIQIGTFKYHIHHGDGLGPGDYRYKFLKKIFTNYWAQKLFKWLHPDIGFSMASYFSRKSRASEKTEERTFKGYENEFLIAYCDEYLKKEEIDFFILGHRHLALDITLSNNKSRYINLGEWFKGRRYLEVDEKGLRIMDFAQSL